MYKGATSIEKIHLNADEDENQYPLYSQNVAIKKQPGATRIWLDGCFDMLHVGHTNAIRQAAMYGQEIFIGCHSDKEIIMIKGPPVMHEEERYEALRACKWVDFVVENYPYSTRIKDMIRFEIDYVIHGDDATIGLDGINSYQEIIDAGKFKMVKRTDGISTTDLINRILHSVRSSEDGLIKKHSSSFEHISNSSIKLLITSYNIAQFGNNRPPSPDDIVVYFAGGFDLFHVGHIKALQKARELGTYLLVGVYDDLTIKKEKGAHYPIMSLNERALGVLSCRYVDEVILGVPCDLTESLIERISANVIIGDIEHNDRLDLWSVPEERDIFKKLGFYSKSKTDAIIKRIVGMLDQHEHLKSGLRF